MRQTTNLSNGINAIPPVQSPLQKFSTLPVGQIIFTNLRHPALSRGAFRDRHGRWVRDAVDAAAAQDERR
jgi:hypothetical protein